MVSIELGFPPPALEVEILIRETGITRLLAEDLVKLAQATRRVPDPGLVEGASTRTLVSAARLINDGLPPRVAARAALVGPLTDDASAAGALLDLVDMYLTHPAG
jgi:nitric oxide reductase NorQ protein